MAGPSYGKWKFPGQGSNPPHSCDPSLCSDNAGSLTRCTAGELLCYLVFIRLYFQETLFIPLTHTECVLGTRVFLNSSLPYSSGHRYTGLLSAPLMHCSCFHLTAITFRVFSAQKALCPNHGMAGSLSSPGEVKGPLPRGHSPSRCPRCSLDPKSSRHPPPSLDWKPHGNRNFFF